MARKQLMSERDGRKLRSLQSRAALVEAFLELVRGGDLAPSADSIAERAGLSRRSVFVHFRDLADLANEAHERQIAWVRERLPIARDSGTIEERVVDYLKQYCPLLEEIAPVRWFALSQAAAGPLPDLTLKNLRSAHRSHTRGFWQILEEHGITAADLGEVALAIDAQLDPVLWRLLRLQSRLSQQRARELLTHTILTLLSPWNENDTRKVPSPRK